MIWKYLVVYVNVFLLNMSLMMLYLLIIDQVAEKTRYLISINHKFDLINEDGVHNAL